MQLIHTVPLAGFHFIAIGILCLGCSREPKDIRLLREGRKSEMRSKGSDLSLIGKAREKYAEAAALGNADAVKMLGDLLLSHDFANLAKEMPRYRKNDYVSGYDDYLIDAKRILENAESLFEQAQKAGCTNGVNSSLEILEGHKKKVADIETKVKEAKMKKAEEDKQRWLAAYQRRQEELRLKREEEKRRVEEEKRRQEEEKRRAEEQLHPGQPEYYIAHDLELSDKAFAEIVRAVNRPSKTGNDIFDERVNKEQEARFLGKRIKLRATVKRVETTIFDEVKLIMDKVGLSISARFDGMSKDEASEIRVGQTLLITGTVSDRPVLSKIALDRCERD